MNISIQNNIAAAVAALVVSVACIAATIAPVTVA